jgi:crossover junction endodeoxyribonuclease RusA
MSVYVSLDWPPTGNHCYTVARGRKILATQGRRYRDEAILRIKEQAAGKRVEGRLRVQIIVNPPDKRARDLDNLIKLPLDCLQKAGVIVNDAHIDELTVQRLHPCLDGLMQIYISEIQPPSAAGRVG